jgi:hypothetical protein
VDNNGTPEAYAYNAYTDELGTVAGHGIQYDMRGNETNDGTNNYLHDDMNMLTQVMIGGTRKIFDWDSKERIGVVYSPAS